MSWWFDQSAVRQVEKLRDTFNVSTYVESGTFRGVNLLFWSYRFKNVIGIEKAEKYFQITKERLEGRPSVHFYRGDSANYFMTFKQIYNLLHPTMFAIIIYLDAHFYETGATTQHERWVVLRELDALSGFKNCILVIHDMAGFEEGLYGLTYDGEPLTFNLLKDSLLRVNPDFHFYRNTREFCLPHTKESIVGVEGIFPDEDTLETISYHRTDRLQHRGTLYCTPEALDLSHFQLVKLEE